MDFIPWWLIKADVIEVKQKIGVTSFLSLKYKFVVEKQLSFWWKFCKRIKNNKSSVPNDRVIIFTINLNEIVVRAHATS